MAKKKRITTNGYIQIFTGTDITIADIRDYKYEHRTVAEKSVIDRPLKEGETVHHLDENRANNSPDNLLVLSHPMHAKLHTWLAKNIITPKPEYQKRIDLGCVRCDVCKTPILPDMKYCSIGCSTTATHRFIHPNKETLEKALWSKSTTSVAKDYGVTDNSITRLAKKLGIEKPPNGYLSKVKAGLICPMK